MGLKKNNPGCGCCEEQCPDSELSIVTSGVPSTSFYDVAGFQYELVFPNVITFWRYGLPSGSFPDGSWTEYTCTGLSSLDGTYLLERTAFPGCQIPFELNGLFDSGTVRVRVYEADGLDPNCVGTLDSDTTINCVFTLKRVALLDSTASPFGRRFLLLRSLNDSTFAQIVPDSDAFILVNDHLNYDETVEEALYITDAAYFLSTGALGPMKPFLDDCSLSLFKTEIGTVDTIFG